MHQNSLALSQATLGRSVQLEDVRDAGRDGITGAAKGDIGFAVRGGNIAGDICHVLWRG